MKATSESTWTFQMIILFMLIFAAFLALTLQYSKAYSVKNRLLTIIEKHEGVTPASIDIMNSYAREKSYTTKAYCPEGWYGALTDSNEIVVADGGMQYNYCYKKNRTENGYYYYDLILFYRFNLPVIGSIGLYQIKGSTKQFIGNDLI